MNLCPPPAQDDHLPPSDSSRGCVAVSISTALILTAGLVVYWTIIHSDSQISLLEGFSLVLFAILFLWISFSFSLATLGFIACLLRLRADRSPATAEACPPQPADENVVDRSAILMPIYNESPTSVFAGLKAMYTSLQATGQSQLFDFYVLSDSTDPKLQAEEKRQWQRALDELNIDKDTSCRLYYRRRSKNIARKAGNIAEFCENWGAHYQFMVILDADSLMDGTTFVDLHKRMVADPQMGILQVVPVPIGHESTFARVQQFSADVYGPVYAQGFTEWSGTNGNYFGHNAILRMNAFKQNCALPVLSGTEPLGGEILSHDFVEAALMLRAGYKVEIATDLSGSYEECPTTINDFAKRDQRWCQGNMQHARLIVSEGFMPFSRLHFLNGVMAYCSAPLWIAFLATTIACALNSGQTEYESIPFAALLLFGVSMFLLLAPKFWGAIVTCLATPRIPTAACVKLWLSVIFEIIASVLIAPLMAILHSRFVLGVLAGKTIQWKAQQRGELGVAWTEAIRDYWPMTVAGIIITAGLALVDASLLAWFSPFLAGLLLAIPVVVVAGSQSIGCWLQRFGILETKAERTPPKIMILRDRFRAS